MSLCFSGNKQQSNGLCHFILMVKTGSEKFSLACFTKSAILVKYVCYLIDKVAKGAYVNIYIEVSDISERAKQHFSIISVDSSQNALVATLNDGRIFRGRTYYHDGRRINIRKLRSC